MNTLVSIALATYNGEKYLPELLDSLYAQSYASIEVVAVDDFSTDNTPELLKQYSEEKGLKFYRNEKNMGFVKTFEKALEFCKGEYIALADQDDIWLPEKIQTLLEHIKNKSLIHSDGELIDSNNQLFAPSFTRYSKKRVDLESFRQLLFYNHITGCTALIKRDLLEHALPFPENILYHDWWLALAASKQKGIKYVPEKLIKYRQHTNVSGGAETMKLDTLVSGSLNKGFMNDRIDKNTKLLNWYRGVYSFHKLDSKEKKNC
jgi:glycosyltransferase involved in cell wall biosynthesis